MGDTMIKKIEAMNKEELNSILVVKEKFEGAGENKPYHKVATMTEIIEKHNGSEIFRERCLNAGYELITLYAVYHQGWEMDEWAAECVKNGKRLHVTTDHNALVEEEIPSASFMSFIKSLF